MDAASSATAATGVSTHAQPEALMPWSRPAQMATVFLLAVATTLLAVHACRGLRWGSRPTQLERNAIIAYQFDVNRADRAELLQIPGVGDSLASRIQEYRRQSGPFQSVSELRHVHGIGPMTLERVRPWISVPQSRTDAVTDSQSITPKQRSKPTSKKEALLTNAIDINLATAAELQRLPGVGPKRAQHIVEERQKRPFTSIEDLCRVSGFGPKTLERLRPYIVVENGAVPVVTAPGF